MKVLFVALSSSYVHTLLSARYLAANSPVPVEIYETNVNIDLAKNTDFIVKKQPDVLAFSCYIFNISYIKKLIVSVRNFLPEVKIVFGGYEAAFNEKELAPYYDYLIKGEGDFSFGKLLEKIENHEIDIPKIIDSGTVKNLDEIRSPYTDEYLSFSAKNKIVYMETCRGCPFSCAYCMSASTRGVRGFSMDRIFSDFKKIMTFSPPLVKLVDRTFNYDVKRAEKILSFLIDTYGTSGTRFHFEMAPELFSEDLFGTIERAPKGLFQFEIGVQSYCPETLEAVNRRADTTRVDANLARLLSYGNVPIHVDLIAGLPKENKASFIDGFNRLIALRPDCLQLGFLKILKGSKIAETQDKGYRTEQEPPYEILCSPDMTEDDLAELKKTEWTLNLFYNSDRFHTSIRFLLDRSENAYELFLSLEEAFRKTGFEKKNLSSSRQCDLLYEYGKERFRKEDVEILEKKIYEDYVSAGNVRKWHKWLFRQK